MERRISRDDDRDDPDFGIFCFCGEPAPLRKSVTQNNPGRRFFGCSKSETREDCGFFCWYEPSVCQDRSDLGPMRVQTRTQALRTDEQCECSDKNKKKKKKTLMVMDHSIWRNLPPEIIDDNVLSLLPVKSLCRLKCVSSKWNSLISSPNFAKTHRHITNNTPNKPQKTLLISSSNDFYFVNFAAVNPTAEKLDFGLSVQDPTHIVRGWGSCNGLVLVSAEGDFYDLFLLNPFTTECKKLPNSPLFDCCHYNNDDDIANGFGYDSSTDDYKVVMLRCRDNPLANQMAVYSLKTDAWKRIQDTCYDLDPEVHSHGAFFNERLHWLCTNTDGSRKVVAFDLWDEIFREVDIPTSFTLSDTYGYCFSVVPGRCLCLLISPDFFGDEIEVWMMMKYGVTESWTKFTIARRMFLNDVLYLASEEEFLFRMSEKVKRVRIQPGREKLVVYNPKKGTLRDMVVCGIPTEYAVVGNYSDTLVSPNHGGQIWRNYEASLGEFRRVIS